MTKDQVFHKNPNSSETIRQTQDATKQPNKLNTKAFQGAPGRDDTEGFLPLEKHGKIWVL